MKNKVVKRIIICAVIAAVAAGGIYGGLTYVRTNRTAEVQLASDLDYGYWGDEVYSSGQITNNCTQTVTLSDTDVVSQVFVREGQEVKAGDQLLLLDTTQQDLDLKMKQLTVENLQNQISIENNQLKQLKNTKPISETVEEPEETDPTESWGAEKSGAAYRYITGSAVPYNKSTADGSAKNPYRFLCTDDAWILGETIQNFAANGGYAVLEVREGNTVKGDLIDSWTIDGSNTIVPDADTRWNISDHSLKEDEVIEEDTEDSEVETGYTSDELKQMIEEEEEKITDLNLDLKKAQLEVQKAQASSTSGVIVATVDGTVTNLQDPENMPDDGTPLMEVRGSGNLYVTGSISELLLDEVQPGQSIQVMSWETGNYTEAEITEISGYPTLDSSSYGGDGNTNVSYYPFTAKIDDVSGFTNGEYVDLTLTVGGAEDGSSNIYLPKAYIRSDSGGYYVMKEGEDNRLVKQYVTTGKSVYGEALEITSGLTGEDYIAFPYGKTAAEGTRCVLADGSEE